MPHVLPDKPIAAWLKTNRLRQVDAEGDPWTQDHLIELMRGRIGWAPARTNYSGYEQGRTTPNRATLTKFVRFWALYGEPGPDLTPPPLPEPAVDQGLAAAIAAQAIAITELAAQVRALVERQPSSEELAGVLDAAVGLAVRETLQAAGVADGPRSS